MTNFNTVFGGIICDSRMFYDFEKTRQLEPRKHHHSGHAHAVNMENTDRKVKTYRKNKERKGRKGKRQEYP